MPGVAFALGNDVVVNFSVEVTDPREGLSSLHEGRILLVLEIELHVYLMEQALLAVAWDQRLSFCLDLWLKQIVLVSEYVVDLTNLILLKMLLAQSPRAVKPFDHL